MNKFFERIRQMNETFNLPVNDKPTDLGEQRIDGLYDTLTEEVDELLKTNDETISDDRVIHIADLLGDLMVYCASEAAKWGIPIERVLDAIMDSQDSKLVDGEPIFNEHGKFLKGPNYEPPEPKIREILFGSRD